MSKSGKTIKNKSKSTGFSESNPIMFTMGYVDLIFELKFSDKDLEKPSDESEENKNSKEKKGNEEDKYFKIEDINTIQDLNFIKDKKEIWDKIVVTGGNDTIKQLIIGNKVSKRKCRIDYIGYGRPKFEGDDDFFDEIYNYVTAKNHLYINQTPLDEKARSSLTIILKHRDKIQTIFYGKSQEEEDKENKKKKKKKKKEEKKEKKKKEKKGKKEKEEEEEEEEDEESEDDDNEEEDNEEEKKEDDYEETEAMKDKKIPKFKRASSILVNLNPSYTRYDMIYINYVDLKNIPGDFKMRDLLELLKFFKNKGSTLFVNFYKPKKPKVQEEEEEEKAEDIHEDDNAIVGEGKTKINKEGKPEEEEEKEDEKEKKEKKKKEGPPRKMIELNQLYDFTNIFFFDTKQCKKIFNKHYETFTEDNINNRKQITRSKIFDYFIKGIATATKEEVTGMKTGLFVDELNKFTIIYASKKAANKYELDSQPHPKINHTNLDLIKEYKRILKTNKNNYYSILISSIVVACGISAPNCQSTEVIYPAFLIALEIIKKKLEIEKNGLEQDESIYKVKVNEKNILKDLERFSSGGKENGFVLDCINRQKSTMKDYVSLYDYHLKTFFSSEYIRKDLKSKGFINTKGFIMYDPVHRNVMGKKMEKKKKKINQEEMKNKLLNSIQGINVPANLKDKEIDAQKLAQNQNLPTESKLPFTKENISIQTTKRRKHRKHKNKGEESSGGSSDENSSGNNSGTESGNEDSSGTVEKTER